MVAAHRLRRARRLARRPAHLLCRHRCFEAEPGRSTHARRLPRSAWSRGLGLDLALHFQFNIFDEVIVPKDLATGDYVLSFRLDAEQTPQIWTHCSDITITD